MLNARFRPIHQWPGKPTPSYARRRGTFRAKYNDTLDLLEREIEKLNGKDIIIEAGFELRDIRNDGWPRATARPKSPGIIVSFSTSAGPLSFPCDRFDAFEDNLRAIALSLEALRQVDRYGVTKNREQYKGFTPLPPPSNGGMSVMDAADFIELNSENYRGRVTMRSRDLFESAYREAAKKLHPDRGGSHEQFVRLQQAKAAMEAHYA